MAVRTNESSTSCSWSVAQKNHLYAANGRCKPASAVLAELLEKPGFASIPVSYNIYFVLICIRVEICVYCTFWRIDLIITVTGRKLSNLFIMQRACSPRRQACQPTDL